MKLCRVILADDHPLLLRGLSDLVAVEEDFAVVGTAASGRETLTLLQRIRPDIAILDISMPDPDGLALLRMIAKLKLPVRVVFLTATISPAQITEALALGVAGLLLKESASDMLIDCLRVIAAGDTWHPAELLARAHLDWPPPVRTGLARLTARERQIVDLVCRGLSNRTVANQLGMTEGTVKIHLHTVFQKLKVTNRTSLAALNFEDRDRA